jgi:phosphomannomutase
MTHSQDSNYRMSKLIASISGIRGIVGASLTPQTILSYVPAFARWCGGGPVVIGFDGRPSGRLFMDAVRSALQASGVDVIDVGMVPTPTVQLMVEHSGARGGIVVTASHNPGEWNGLKFLNADGVFLDAGENTAFFALAAAGDTTYAAYDGLGALRPVTNAVERHIARVLACPLLDTEAIRTRASRVVVDAVNASGSVAMPALLEALGCEVIPLACDGSGVFPHTPEPLPEHLTSLGDAVRLHGADLGIAVDPDADRIVVFDEHGDPFGEEYSITTAVHAVLSRIPDSARACVVVNLSTTRAVDDVARRFGATVYRAPVGEINVVKLMKEMRAVVGGEGSGGVILPQVHAGRDSLVGAALLLQALTDHGGTASAFRASLPEWVIRKHKYAAEGIDATAALGRAAAAFSNEQIDTRDGVRIDFLEGWVHLRTSNTEPIMRVIAEGRSAAEADALAGRVAAVAFADTAHEV